MLLPPTMEKEISTNNEVFNVDSTNHKKLKDGGIILGNPEIKRLKITPKQNSLPISIESVNPLLDNLGDRKLGKFRNTVSEPNIFVTPAAPEGAPSDHVIVFPKGTNNLSPLNQLYGTYKKKVTEHSLKGILQFYSLRITLKFFVKKKYFIAIFKNLQTGVFTIYINWV